MFSHWKIALWLGLLSEYDSWNKDNKSKKKKKSFSNKNLIPPEGSPNRTWFVRGVAFSALIIILYLIFGYGTPRYVEIKKISCNSQKLELETASGPKYTLSKFSEKKAGSAYASKIGLTFGEDIYDVVLLAENGSKISFRVSKTKSTDKWSYKVSSGCVYSRSIDCKKGSGACGCCKDGDCCADGGSCDCKDNGCCTDTDGKCACCAFMNWIDYAILNLENPNRITPASVFFSLLPSLLYLAFFVFMARSAAKGQHMGIYGQGGLFKVGQSLSKTAKSDVTFDDVAGIKEEKDELIEIVDYLRRPGKYNSMGARTPKGVILYGPPGTGKTLLAKAVAGEAGVPFIEVAGSSFDDMFVGTGAKRVRDLFVKAKKLAPCIVFIDEIDAVAGKRGNKYVGGGINDQTINQLLSEMDGFNTMTGIVIMAATNRLDSMDSAILRPGRFDRHIQINLPDIAERIEILKVHARNKNISSKVDLADIARKTPGFSGAQLENVLNEATLWAVRHNKKVIDHGDLDEAIDRVMGGPAKKGRKVLFKDKLQIAYHEAGHAIVGLYSKEGEVVEKITIIPRGNAGGYILSVPEKQESFIQTKSEFLARISTALGGRASEEIFFGKEKIGSGAANDLFKVTQMVRAMVTKLGMTESLGLVQYEPSEGLENPHRAYYSDQYAELIDKEMNRIVDDQYENAKRIIKENSAELLLIVECLLLIETIDRRQIDYIHENKQLPPEALEIKAKLEEKGESIDIRVQP